MYVYDIMIKENAGECVIEIPDFKIEISFKGSRREAIAITAEHLKTSIQAYLALAREVPEPQDVPICSKQANKENKYDVVTLAIEVTPPFDGFVTVEQAMEILCVSQPRIAHLLRDGHLKAISHGRRKLITRESLEAYLATPRKPGRPKKGITYAYLNLGQGTDRDE